LQLRIDDRYPTILRDVIRRLVELEFADAGEGLAVHVKAVRPQPRWFLPCQREACRPNVDLDRDPKYGRDAAEHLGFRRGHLHRTRRVARGWHDDAYIADVRRWVEHRRPCGSAYNGVPLPHARPLPGVQRLATIRMTLHPEQLTYPYVWRYPRLKTSGQVTYTSWQEELLHTLAHEARHIVQYRDQLPASEVDAELHAHRRLERWRQAEPETDSLLLAGDR
jgi:hypothetical protein